MVSGNNEEIPRFLRPGLQRPKLFFFVAVAVGIAAAALASRLQLRTAFSELLPSNDPGVVVLAKTQKRMGDLTMILVGVHSPDRAANVRYAEALTAKLQALPPTVCALAAYNVREIRDFFEKNKWLYLSETDLESIRDRLRSEIGRRKNPLLVDLAGDDETPEQMKNRLTGQDILGGRFPGGVFTSEGGDYVWIAALPPGGLFGERGGQDLWDATRRLVALQPTAQYHPQMRVKVAGPVATAIASRQAVERDILWVTVTCLVVVALSIGLYFRHPRAIFLIGFPAVIGTIMAFAVAELDFGYLNSSTAFLGSIILGNGINCAIILMSRYEEWRAAGATAAIAIGNAIAGTWRGTGVAALCASAAYASLMVTSFRGFYQFGVMGAVGALFCWLATYFVLPALLILLDRNSQVQRGRPPLRLTTLGTMLQKGPRAILALSVVVTVLGLVGLKHFLKDPFEYDFRKLNAEINATEESREFDRNLDRLFGRWPSPTIVLADRQDQVEPLRDAIRAADAASTAAHAGKRAIGQMATVYEILPGRPEVQERKLALLAQIRKLANDPVLEAASDKDRKQLAQLSPPADLRVLGPMDLPPLARRPFTEADGTVGRVVLVYPPEVGLSTWNGKDLLLMAGVLQHIALPGGEVIDTSGTAVVFGAMIRSILNDGPIATVASLLAVFLIVAPIIRPLSTALLVLGLLVAGVVWMVGAAGWASVHVTFLNFVALPITFGIGIEYALNMVARYRQDGDIIGAVKSTGGAVALCSWTTIVGYGSLLTAKNHALNGFGTMAILGELSCLAAALIALPALVLSRKRTAPTASATAPVVGEQAS